MAHTVKLGGVLLALALLLSPRTYAKDPDVVLVVKSIDGFLADIKHVFQSSGTEDLADIVDGMIVQYTQGEGLIGINTDKPAGLYINISEDGIPEIVVYIPVTDIKEFRNLLAQFMPAQQDGQNGTFSMEGPEQTFYGRTVGDYCFISPLAEPLNSVPKPEEFAVTKYDVGLKVNLANISQDYKDTLLEQMLVQAQELPIAKSESEMKGRRIAEDILLGNMRMFLDGAASMTVGMNIDDEEDVIQFFADVVPQEGTDLAKMVEQYRTITSVFSGVVNPELGISFLYNAPLMPDQREPLRDAVTSLIEDAHTSIKNSKKFDSAQQEKAHDIINRVNNIMNASGDTGKMDVVVTADKSTDGTMFWVAGAVVPDSNEVNSVLEEYAALSASGAEVGKVEIDLEKHNGARIHRINSSRSLTETQIAKGPFVIAVGDSFVIAARGGDALAHAKAAVDNVGKANDKVSSVSMKLDPGKILHLLPSEDPQNRATAVDAFAGGGSFLKFRIDPTETGASMQLEMGSSFMKYLSLLIGEQLGALQ